MKPHGGADHDRYDRRMWKQTACLLVAIMAAGACRPPPARSTVTYHQRIRFMVPAEPAAERCVAACASNACWETCPAVTKHAGSCLAALQDGQHCRETVEEWMEEYDGSCREVRSPRGVTIARCAEHGRGAGGTAGTALGILALAALTLISLGTSSQR